MGLLIDTGCLGETGVGTGVGALCSGFVLEVLDVLYNPVLHGTGGGVLLYACSVSGCLFLSG